MSGTQTVVEFNFIVNITSDALEELKPSEIEDVTFDNMKDVKVNLRNRLSRIIRDSFESMGSVHLKEESFSPSNERLSSTHRSIHFGDSPGRTTHISKDNLIRFRLSIVSFIDYEVGMQPNDIEIWDKVRETLDGKKIYLDKVGGVTGTINVDDLEGSSWNARETSMGSDKHHPQTSEIEKSQDASFEKTMNDDTVGLPFSLDGGSDVDEDNPLDDYDTVVDSVSDIQDTYEKYENDSIQVRKPTESEIEEITSAVYQQIEKMMDSDEPVYIEEVPDNWENATCSRCSKDTDSVLLKFQEESRRVIRERLRRDFGLGTENDFTDSRVTNFYVTEDGELLVRPEEVVSWVISVVNETRPYCEACNAEVGGDGKHTDFRKILVKSTNGGRDELDDSSVDKYVNQTSPMLDYERIQFDTGSSGENKWSKYRSPTRDEAKRIERSITEHLWRLGTRSQEENSESGAVYKTLFKRDYDQDFSKLGNHKCDVCGSPVSGQEHQNESLRKFEKHHIEPVASNRIPIIIQKVKDMIDRSKNADSKSSPIKVSKDSSRFLFTDEFLSLVEALYRNVDTVALFCDECDEAVENKNDILSTSVEEKEDDNAEEDESLLLEDCFGVGSRKRVEFLCPICRKRDPENDVQTANVLSGKCFQLDEDSRNEPVPVVAETIVSEDLPVGLCVRHKNEISQRVETLDLKGSTREEKLRSLLTQLAY